MGGITYQVREGDVILMPPFLTHLIRATSEVPLIQYIVHFDLFGIVGVLLAGTSRS